MALSPKLKERATISEEELIRKGGTSGMVNENVSPEEDRAFKRVQLRIPLDYLDRISSLLKKRPCRVPRHTWLIEAIAEKLGKEENANEVNLTSSQP